MQTITDNLPLILGGIAFVLFTIGLVLALRTESGRNTLARASVKLAVFALALAERWLGGYIMPAPPANTMTIGRELSPREQLQSWLGR